jgi:hypothetical protein
MPGCERRTVGEVDDTSPVFEWADTTRKVKQRAPAGPDHGVEANRDLAGFLQEVIRNET